MLTAAQLKSIMPRLTDQRNGELLPFLTSAMAEFAIEAPARAAAFLAQLAHESGQFRFMEEIWGPTDAQRRYEPVTKLSKDLGNTEAGDGKRFKGRGPIQLTGRANYKRFGDLLGVDLVADPPRAANPDVAFRIAGLFWSRKGLNALADLTTDDAFKEITRRINGGFNGLADRQSFYALARRVLGVTGAAVSLERAAPPVPPDDLTFTRGHEAIRAQARRRTAPPARKAASRPSARKRTATARKKTVSARKKTAGARTKTVIARKKTVEKSRARKPSRSAVKKR